MAWEVKIGSNQAKIAQTAIKRFATVDATAAQEFTLTGNVLLLPDDLELRRRFVLEGVQKVEFDADLSDVSPAEKQSTRRSAIALADRIENPGHFGKQVEEPVAADISRSTLAPATPPTGFWSRLRNLFG